MNRIVDMCLLTKFILFHKAKEDVLVWLESIQHS